ncbi:MAG: 6-bladed beta-propeller [Gemmatimonadota bacterium]
MRRWLVGAGRVRSGALLTSVALAVACGGDAPAPALQLQIDTVADTIAVRNLAGSLVPAGMQLVPEIRIGALEGPDEEIFGAISGLAVGPEGTIYVYDRQVPALRAYNAAGEFVRTLGRQGGGPGEYENSDGGMAVLSDGRVVIRDPGNARFTVFHPDGTLDTSWPGRGGFFTSAPLSLDDTGLLYSVVIRPYAEGENAPAGSLWLTRVLQMEADGTPLDTLSIPFLGYESPSIRASRDGGTSVNAVPFTETLSWSIRGDGSFVVGIGNEYVVRVFRPDGSVIRVEKPAERVPVEPGERDDAEARATHNMRRTDPAWTWNGPPIPAEKPAFHRVLGGDDNRIWVHVPQAAETLEVSEDEERRARDANRPPPPRYREPVAFDVFESDGRYLARVQAPMGFSLYPAPVFRGDHVWAVVQDELDVSYVVRFRLEPAG